MVKVTKIETKYYDEEVPTSLEEFMSWEFTSGGTTGDDFKVFSRLFRSRVEKSLPTGARLVNFSSGHYDVSGFIEREGKYVYFGISDVRHFPGEWNRNILIRTAKGPKDYTGGSNGYTALDNLGRAVARMLGGEVNLRLH